MTDPSIAANSSALSEGLSFVVFVASIALILYWWRRWQDHRREQHLISRHAGLREIQHLAPQHPSVRIKHDPFDQDKGTK